MIASSAQPNRNAGRRPHALRMKTKIPPVSGKAPATSASVSAPQSATTPPAIQTPKSGTGPGSRFVTLAGVRKMPEPIVMPMTTAMALHRPRRRGSSVTGASREPLGRASGIPYGSAGEARERDEEAERVHRHGECNGLRRLTAADGDSFIG